eukprot:gene22375-28497_t
MSRSTNIKECLLERVADILTHSELLQSISSKVADLLTDLNAYSQLVVNPDCGVKTNQEIVSEFQSLISIKTSLHTIQNPPQKYTNNSKNKHNDRQVHDVDSELYAPRFPLFNEGDKSNSKNTRSEKNNSSSSKRLRREGEDAEYVGSSSESEEDLMNLHHRDDNKKAKSSSGGNNNKRNLKSKAFIEEDDMFESAAGDNAVYATTRKIETRNNKNGNSSGFARKMYTSYSAADSDGEVEVDRYEGKTKAQYEARPKHSTESVASCWGTHPPPSHHSAPSRILQSVDQQLTSKCEAHDEDEDAEFQDDAPSSVVNSKPQQGQGRSTSISPFSGGGGVAEVVDLSSEPEVVPPPVRETPTQRQRVVSLKEQQQQQVELEGGGAVAGAVLVAMKLSPKMSSRSPVKTLTSTTTTPQSAVRDSTTSSSSSSSESGKLFMMNEEPSDPFVVENEEEEEEESIEVDGDVVGLEDQEQQWSRSPPPLTQQRQPPDHHTDAECVQIDDDHSPEKTRPAATNHRIWSQQQQQQQQHSAEKPGHKRSGSEAQADEKEAKRVKTSEGSAFKQSLFGSTAKSKGQAHSQVHGQSQITHFTAQMTSNGEPEAAHKVKRLTAVESITDKTTAGRSTRSGLTRSTPEDEDIASEIRKIDAAHSKHDLGTPDRPDDLTPPQERGSETKNGRHVWKGQEKEDDLTNCKKGAPPHSTTKLTAVVLNTKHQRNAAAKSRGKTDSKDIVDLC